MCDNSALAEDIREMRGMIERLDISIRGNGKAGLNSRMTVFELFMDSMKEREKWLSRLVWGFILSQVLLLLVQRGG